MVRRAPTRDNEAMLLFARALGIAAIVSVGLGAQPTPARPGAPRPAGCIPASQCCKVCDRGQACGNSCISRKKTCHKGRGCACDAVEICADTG